MGAPNVRPLSQLKVSEQGVVIALNGGRQFVNRLIGMGLSVGSRVQVIQGANGRPGPVLVAAGGARLGIGHGMAEKVSVAVDGH